MTFDDCFDDLWAEIIIHNPRHNITITIDGTQTFPAPHINVYNSGTRVEDATRVATLSLFTDEIFYRGEDWIDQWILTKREIRMIRWTLLKHPCECYYNYWQRVCMLWNEIYDEYHDIGWCASWKFTRRYDKHLDEEFKNQPLYIPSTQPIPKWHY